MQDSQILTKLIDTKHQVLTQLRELGRRQSALISGGDVAALLKLLAVKQQLISKLQSVERELTPHYVQDPERRVWSTPQERAICAQMAAECNSILDEIVRLEKQGADHMAMRRNEVADQLNQVYVASQVRSAYEAQRSAPA
jgi:hypothetical protein